MLSSFLRLWGLLLLSLCFTCSGSAPLPEVEPFEEGATPQPPYSLGQWSFNRELFAGEMTNEDFVVAAGEMGFAGVEYVSQFFQDKVEDEAFLTSLAAAAKAAGVEGRMILVDNAGNLGASDSREQMEAFRQHVKWVRAAKMLGCPAIRVNAHGDGTPEEIMEACTYAIGELAKVADYEGVQILIENHGGVSNNGRWLGDLLERLAPMGVKGLADFDNWCVRRLNGQLWGAPCTKRYDRYQGMMELMPYAGGISVKAFNFDAEGNEPDMDYAALFDIIHAHHYDGFLGIEYEGDDLPAREGILRTLNLARRSWERKPIITPLATQRLDTLLANLVDRGSLAGASALIFEKGEEVYFNAVGHANRAAEVPMDRNTIVQIFSMTKPLTGVALMQLFEQGKFQLDDPVAKYLPAFANMEVFVSAKGGQVITEKPHRPMTVRDLTRHTAGFYNGGDVPGLQQLRAAADLGALDYTLSELAIKMAKVPLRFHPGEQWEYGPSVDVQALLVERLSGQPFDEYLREHVLDPLGMDDTRYLVPEADRKRMSAMYVQEAANTLKQLRPVEGQAFNLNKQVLTPGGWGLTSTLDDYQRFARMLMNRGALEGDTILQPTTVRLMATNHLADEVTERLWLPAKGQVGFGIDFAVRLRPPATDQENPGRVGEFFWDGAASTLFWVDPANELTAVLFVQLRPYDQIGLHRAFRAAVYGGNSK